MNTDSEELDFFDEAFDYKVITWKIRDVLSLPDLVGYKVLSPSFSFANATWELRMYPYGKIQESQGYIEFSIMRLNSRIPEHYLFYEYYIKTPKGKFLSSSTSQCLKRFQEDWVVEKYLEKSKLIEMKNVILLNGVLTIICQIRTKKIAMIDRYCQNETTVSLSDSPEQTSKQELESSADTFRDSSKQTSKQKPESSATTCRDSNSTSNDPVALSCMKVLAELKDMFLKQENCDVIIKVKGQEFPAHKAILAARSLVFASTFKNDMKEKHTGVVEIEDCEPSSFSEFLLFLYCGKIDNLTTENIFSLFTTADKYDVQDLRSQCLEFIKKNLSIRNLCNAVTLAFQYSEDELLQLSIDFFAKNLQEVIITVEWQELLIQNPIQCNELMIKALKSNQVKLNSNG